MEGRDIGTVVFPDAAVKVFLIASAATSGRGVVGRAARAGRAVDEAALTADIVERDRRDSERAAAPLRPAPDAVVVDTTRWTWPR